MNRQVLPSMLLSVLIVCASAVALRPIEGDRHRAAGPADATATDSAPASPQFGDEPEVEAIPSEDAPTDAETATGFEEEEPEAADLESQEETPEPEPAPIAEPDAPDPFEDDPSDEAAGETEAEEEAPPPLPLPEATEPFDEADEPVVGQDDEAPEPVPAFDDFVAAPSDEPATVESEEFSDEPSGAFVGPPIEAASRDETPAEEIPAAPEPPPLPESSAPSATADEDAAEPSPSPSPEPGSIRIPRSNSMWGVPARVDRPREPSARVREPGGVFEPARRSDAMRTRPFLWTPRQ